MLAIRLQRTGRSGHAQFRVIVQDSRFSPSGGRIVAYLGNYNPHTKTATIDSQEAAKYLENGAQPSDRVARLLQSEGVKLPAWVKLSEPRERTVRNPDKRRSTRPAAPEAPAAATEAPAEPAEATPPETETVAETVEPAAEETAAAPEAPAEPEVPVGETAEAKPEATAPEAEKTAE